MTAHGAVGRIQQLLIPCYVSFPVASHSDLLRSPAGENFRSGTADTSRARQVALPNQKRLGRISPAAHADL